MTTKATLQMNSIFRLTEVLMRSDLMVSEEFAAQIRNRVINKTMQVEDLDQMSYFGAFREKSALRYTVENGTAVIPVSGAMFPGGDYSYDWGTGYEFITNAIAQANNDPGVTKILLVMRTPGGTVDGAFETYDVIAASSKPVETFAHHAYSAGYLLASATSKITVAPMGGVGSIGVITTHFDYSKMLAEEGIKVTLIHKGDRKADGNPFTPLSEDVKKRIEDRLEVAYSAFVDAVSTGRKIDSQAVRDTEAGVFTAEDALALRLVDSIGKLKDQLSFNAGKIGNFIQGEIMPTENTSAADAPTGNQAQASQSPSLTSADIQAAIVAERERFNSILTCDEAKGKPSMAMVLARQGMSLDQARDILKVATVETSATAQTDQPNHFNEAMSRPENSQDVANDSNPGSDPQGNFLLNAAKAAGVIPS